MAIEFECRECGRVLRVKEKDAGRRTKCPKCGTRIRVPDDPDADIDDLFDADYDDTPRPRRKKKRATKGRRSSSSSSRPGKRGRSRGSSQRSAVATQSDGELTAVDWVLVVLCGGIAFIVGIVACINGDATRGGKMIGFAILQQFILVAVFLAMRSS